MIHYKINIRYIERNVIKTVFQNGSPYSGYDTGLRRPKFQDPDSAIEKKIPLNQAQPQQNKVLS